MLFLHNFLGARKKLRVMGSGRNRVSFCHVDNYCHGARGGAAAGGGARSARPARLAACASRGWGGALTQPHLQPRRADHRGEGSLPRESRAGCAPPTRPHPPHPPHVPALSPEPEPRAGPLERSSAPAPGIPQGSSTSSPTASRSTSGARSRPIFTAETPRTSRPPAPTQPAPAGSQPPHAPTSSSSSHALRRRMIDNVYEGLGYPSLFKRAKLPVWFIMPLAFVVEKVGDCLGKKPKLNTFAVKMMVIHRRARCVVPQSPAARRARAGGALRPGRLSGGRHPARAPDPWVSVGCVLADIRPGTLTSRTPSGTSGTDPSSPSSRRAATRPTHPLPPPLRPRPGGPGVSNISSAAVPFHRVFPPCRGGRRRWSGSGITGSPSSGCEGGCCCCCGVVAGRDWAQSDLSSTPAVVSLLVSVLLR